MISSYCRSTPLARGAFALVMPQSAKLPSRLAFLTCEAKSEPAVRSGLKRLLKKEETNTGQLKCSMPMPVKVEE